MNIAGYKFHLFNGPTLDSTPGIFIYIHQATGKHFVRTMRNIKKQRGKNNYPTMLKDLLKTNESVVSVYVADAPKDTKEALYRAYRTICAHLALKGVLYKNPKPKCCDMCYSSLLESDRLTVWKLTHKLTGAVFYFEAIKGTDVTDRVEQRMRTFSNCVIKGITNTNRVMYHFAKKFFPLNETQWDVEDLNLEFLTERDTTAHIAMLSKKHLEDKVVVLNRINNIDALYYRNTVLKLPHIGIDEYLM